MAVDHTMKFVKSDAGTIHVRLPWYGDSYEYHFHPMCGQELPAGKSWNEAGVSSLEELIMSVERDTVCRKCIDKYEWNRLTENYERQRKEAGG